MDEKQVWPMLLRRIFWYFCGGKPQTEGAAGPILAGLTPILGLSVLAQLMTKAWKTGRIPSEEKSALFVVITK